MDVPIGSKRGKLIRHASKSRDYNEAYFDITGLVVDRYNNVTTYFIKFERPNHYGFNNYDGDGTGELTKRKNGKFMFRGHTRLYSDQEVEFIGY